MENTALLLIASRLIFLIGAGFWQVHEFERQLGEMLSAVHRRRRRWLWIHAWMVAGTLISIRAVASLAILLGEHGGGRLAASSRIAWTVGCVLMAQAARTGEVPAAYPARHRAATASTR